MVHVSAPSLVHNRALRGPLPRRRREIENGIAPIPYSNAHCSEPAGDNTAVGSVTVSNEIVGCLVPRERLGNLLSDPLGGRMVGDAQRQKSPALEPQDDQHTNNRRKPIVGTTRKSIAPMPAA